MNKLRQLETKKLLKELEFIESDLDYKSEVVSEADGDFLNSVNKFLGTQPQLKEMFDKKINHKIDQMIKRKENELRELEKTPEDGGDGAGKADTITNSEGHQNEQEALEQETKNKEIIFINPKIKSLYREIAKATHPDKITNKKINDYYMKATTMYDRNDLAGIYAICDELNIDYEIDIEDIRLISDKINMFKQRIGFLESTFTFKWFHCEEQSEKNHIILNYIRMQLCS
jgi:6-pyruvoyl-tetrahydropterin synthase